MEHDPERRPADYILSDVGQPVIVLAKSGALLNRGHSSDGILLGSLSAKETNSSDIEVNYLHDDDGTFSCNAVIGIPEQMTDYATEYFSQLAQQLTVTGSVKQFNQTGFFYDRQSGDDVVNIISLIHYRDNPSMPAILVDAVNVNSTQYDSSSPFRSFDYAISSPDEVVLNVGKTVSEIANLLHSDCGSDSRAQLIIQLPGKSLLEAQSEQEQEPETEEAIEVSQAEVTDDEWAWLPSFDDFGGLDSEIASLRDVVADLQMPPALFEKYGIDPPHGILLHGPSGVGKTELIKALTRELRANYLPVHTGDITSMWVGKSIENLRTVYSTACASPGMIVLFFDEFDGLFSSDAGGNAGAAKALIAEFKVILNDAHLYPNVVIAAAANSLDNFDPNLLRAGRFDTVLSIGLPSESARARIFGKYLFKHEALYMWPEFEDKSDTINLEALARESLAFSGKDIQHAISIVLRNRIRREHNGETDLPLIGQQELVQAIWQHRRSRPSDT